MATLTESAAEIQLPTAEEKTSLLQLAQQRRWPLALILVGWLHLAAFSGCYYLTIVRDYHESDAYLGIWLGELLAMGLIFRLCGGPRSAALVPGPMELLVRRIWITYFILAFNLGSLNFLRGHRMFEFFPAMASLASFAFLMMTLLVDRRFFAAVLVMFGAGLLMAANFWHAFLIFALAWWLVLQGIGWYLLSQKRPQA